MKKEGRTAEFQDTTDWAERVRETKTAEIRRGVLAAGLNPENFLDCEIMSDTFTQAGMMLRVLYENIGIQANPLDPETVRYGLMLVLTKVLFKDGIHKLRWHENTKQSVYMYMMNVLAKSINFYKMDEWVDDNLRKYLKKFFWEVLITFDPNETSDAEANMIVIVVTAFERDHLLIEAVGWIGSQPVIDELISRLDKRPDGQPDFRVWDNEVGQRLCIHLGQAGELAHYFAPKAEQVLA